MQNTVLSKVYTYVRAMDVYTIIDGTIPLNHNNKIWNSLSFIDCFDTDR